MGRCLPWRKKPKAALNPQSHADRGSGSSEGPRVPSPSRLHSPAVVRSPRRSTTARSSNAAIEAQGVLPTAGANRISPPSRVPAGRATAPRPCRREDLRIAILCALPLEYDAVSLVFDELWDDSGRGSVYKTGRIGEHNVVLALLSGMGKASAASTAASIRSRYHYVRLAFLVGICGGLPQSGDEEILLGDVVISKGIIQYDFGRRYPDRFEHRDGTEDNMARPDKEFRTLLSTFETADGRQQLQKRTADFLAQLQAKATRKNCGAEYGYPGAAEDKLFEPSYRHKHHVSPTCICSICETGSDPVCDDAVKSACDTLRCDERYLLPRKRLKLKRESKTEKAQEPAIHIGPVGSGDTVIKSGEHRDGIARPKGIIAFEMEGAGIAEEIPCVVIKGVCDYADCHKNKKWQNFAAATATSALKAVLERYMPTAESPERLTEASPRQPHFLVPFGRNRDFVGRESTLERLLERIPPSADKDDCQRTAIEGLGGVGKTQIALEAAFRVRNEHPDCHVFWVPAVDVTTFENAYREIGQQLDIAGIDEDKADVKLLVKTALSKTADNWLLIIDNADDVELLFGTTGATPLCDYLPSSYRGSILFTTRTREAVVRLDIPQRGVVKLAEMTRPEAVDLLQRNVAAHQLNDTQSTASLLDFLADLPLAIRQASAYMSKTGITTTQYLNYCRSGDEHLIELLSKDFEDRARYKNTRNPVAATWLISFRHISRDNQLAAQYLRFMSFLAEKEIPKSLLPHGNRELEAYEAIGTLKAYAFITERAGQESYDIHRLVRLAMRNWLAEKGELKACVTAVMQQLDKAFPSPEHENRAIWVRYLPHALTALGFRDHSTNDAVKSSLLSNVAGSSFMLGKYRDAEELYEQALKLSTQVLGVDHYSTLARMNNLALVLRNQGKYEEAETMYRQVLNLWTQVLGADHPNTLRSMDNLALVLRNQGKHEEAETIHRQALRLWTQALGVEHHDTLISMNNFADVLYSQGKYEEAETMHRQVLNLWIQVLGVDHPNTLSSMDNLASVLCKQGKYEEAETMHRQALKLWTQVLGVDHPDTLVSINNLAFVLHSQGKYEEAETMYQQALKLWIQVLGADHPNTLMSMNNLAFVLHSQGKHEEAETMHRQGLKLRTQVLGADHPDTLVSMNNLADVLYSQGKYEEAETMHRQAFKLRTQVLGADHPNTLSSMNNLTLVLRSQGKYEEAETIH